MILDDLHGTFDRCETENDLKAALSETFGFFGFKKFSYLGFNPPDPHPRCYVATNYEPQWVGHYTAKNYIFADPTIVSARTRRLPLAWDGTEHIVRNDGLTRKQRKIMDESVDFGLRAGITIPIHAPHGEFACLTGIFDGSSKALRKLLRERMQDLYFAGLLYHDALWEKFLHGGTEESPLVTAREAEVLTWAARGKTNWEIARILNLSEDGVKFHLKNASRRLNTTSKVHTVTKALCLGVIRP